MYLEVPKPQDLLHDEWSGRLFLGSWDVVERAVVECNLRIAETGEVVLNEFYDHVGLPPIPPGHDMGWSSNRIQLREPQGIVTPQHRPALSISFYQWPTSLYGPAGP